MRARSLFEGLFSTRETPSRMRRAGLEKIHINGSLSNQPVFLDGKTSSRRWCAFFHQAARRRPFGARKVAGHRDARDRGEVAMNLKASLSVTFVFVALGAAFTDF